MLLISVLINDMINIKIKLYINYTVPTSKISSKGKVFPVLQLFTFEATTVSSYCNMLEITLLAFYLTITFTDVTKTNSFVLKRFSRVSFICSEPHVLRCFTDSGKHTARVRHSPRPLPMEPPVLVIPYRTQMERVGYAPVAPGMSFCSRQGPCAT